MLHGDQQECFDLSFCLPAECADRLQDGRADIGIVPAIELPRQELLITADTAIACRGPVRSILLVSKVPFEKIRTLATDSSSRTSVVLSEIVLRRKYGADPVLQTHPPRLEAMLAQCDAALIIGDPALLIEPSQLPYPVLDLGQEWTEMTGLPMVFAVWAARRRYPSEPFRASLEYGMAHMEEIVAAEYARRGITSDLAREYLTRNVTFDLGADERAGLNLFLQYAREIHQTELRTVSV
jgi:predicted solute-binding protein